MCDENGNRGGFTIKVKGKAFRAKFEVDMYISAVSRFPASSWIKKLCKLSRFYLKKSQRSLAPVSVGKVDQTE